jgi:hypothetical protein
MEQKIARMWFEKIKKMSMQISRNSLMRVLGAGLILKFSLLSIPVFS